MKIRENIKIAILIGIIEAVLMFIMFLVIDFNLSGILKKNAVDNMHIVARDRAQIVESYINGCVDVLEGYSKSTEAREMLMHKGEQEYIDRLQKYTNEYAKSCDNLEGLYIAEWDTFVWAHTNPDSILKTFREKDAAEDLRRQIVQRNQAFCTGIVLAPVTKKNVIPIYAPVYDDNGNAIGFAGAAFYTTGLEEILNSFAEENDIEVRYSLINAMNGQYIFDDNEELVGTECMDDNILQAMSDFVNGRVRGKCSYSNDYEIASCYYMYSRSWMFIVKDSNENVFREVPNVRFSLVVICVAVTVIMIVATILGVGFAMKPMKVITGAIDELKAGKYVDDSELESLAQKNSEFGTIAIAVEELHTVLASQYELFQEILKVQTVGSLVLKDKTFDVMLINNMAIQMLGMDLESGTKITAELIRNHIPEEYLETVDEKISELEKTDDELVFEVKVNHDDGSAIYALTHGKRVHLTSGESVFCFSLMDITERKRLEENLLILSETDGLTGICNRRSGEAQIARCLNSARPGMFCLFDCNKFKYVNDTYGHNVGDDVLIAIANCMKKTFRTSDVILRLGGDEFAVYACDVADKTIGELVINRFFTALNQLEIESAPDYKITVSLGAVFCDGTFGFDQIYTRADSLMYDCKKIGGNAFLFYDEPTEE